VGVVVGSDPLELLQQMKAHLLRLVRGFVQCAASRKDDIRVHLRQLALCKQERRFPHESERERSGAMGSE
jgi:hypothetical protein